MANLGESFPFDFAQGILQIRTNLSQKEAELREMKITRSIQAELEAAKIEAQKYEAGLRASSVSAANASRERIAQGNQAAQEKATEARIKIETQKQDDERTGMVNDAMHRFSNGESVFLNKQMQGIIKPEMFQGPEIDDPANPGKKLRATSAIIPADDGSGVMITPLTNPKLAAEYAENHAKVLLSQQNAALRAEQIRKLEMSNAEYQKNLEDADYYNPQEKKVLLDFWYHTRGLELAGKSLDIPKTEAEQRMYDRAQAVAERILGRTLKLEDPPKTRSVTGDSPIDRGRREMATAGMPRVQLPAPEQEAIDAVGGTYKLIQPGVYDMKSGQFREFPSGRTPSNLRLGEGQGQVERHQFYDAQKNLVRTEYRTRTGDLIRGENVVAATPVPVPAATSSRSGTGFAPPPPVGGASATPKPADDPALTALRDRMRANPKYEFTEEDKALLRRYGRNVP